MLGAQTTYAKTVVVLPTNSVIFTIDYNQKVNSLEKEQQPNIDFLKEKYKFVVSESVSAQNTYDFSEYYVGYLANTVDDVLEMALKTFKNDFPTNWKYNKIADKAYEIVDGTGKKWGTFYKDRIVANGRTVIGTRGNPILNKIPLAKNMKYEVDGFIFQTDDLGRVVKTNADLDDIARIRLGNQQIRAVDIKDGIKGSDQGGHIVASRFFGPGEQINMYSQKGVLNQGAWKNMENLWAREMVAGKDVKIQVKAIFEGTSKRPSKFKVQFTIDGQPFNR